MFACSFPCHDTNSIFHISERHKQHGSFADDLCSFGNGSLVTGTGLEVTVWFDLLEPNCTNEGANDSTKEEPVNVSDVFTQFNRAYTYVASSVFYRSRFVESSKRHTYRALFNINYRSTHEILIS